MNLEKINKVKLLKKYSESFPSEIEDIESFILKNLSENLVFLEILANGSSNDYHFIDHSIGSKEYILKLFKLSSFSNNNHWIEENEQITIKEGDLDNLINSLKKIIELRNGKIYPLFPPKELLNILYSRFPELYVITKAENELISMAFESYKNAKSEKEKEFFKKLIEGNKYLNNNYKNPFFREKMKDITFFKYTCYLDSLEYTEYEGSYRSDKEVIFLSDEELSYEEILKLIQEWANQRNSEILSKTIKKEISSETSDNDIYVEIYVEEDSQRRLITRGGQDRLKNKNIDYIGPTTFKPEEEIFSLSITGFKSKEEANEMLRILNSLIEDENIKKEVFKLNSCFDTKTF